MFRRFMIGLVATFTALIGTIGITSQPASANASCASNNMCLFECFLTQSCGWEVQGLFSNAGCNDVSWIETASVKNNSGRKYFVYKTTNCTGTKSTIYPNTHGNMNNEWLSFNGIQRTLV
jgi:hypothetical protein